MARVVSFSCLNPIQFAAANKVQSAQYTTRYFDEGWNYSKTIKDFEDGKPFLHKVRFSDLISLQVLVGPYTDPIMLPDPPDLYLLDCNNNVVDEVSGYIETAEVYNLSSYTLPGGTDINATIFQYNFQLASYFTTVENREGYYRLMLRTAFDDGVHMDHYSEWIDLKVVHPGTVLLQYHNSINDLDTNFEQVHPRFSMRVEGDMHSYEPGATVTGYTSQTEVFTQLSSHPYDTYKFTAINAPDFLLKKLNHVFSCDSLMIDGKVFSRDDGAKWEVQRLERHPLKGLTVQLRSGMNTHMQATLSKRSYFEEAGFFSPKFYHNLQLNNFISQGIILRENCIVEDQADGEALAADLNIEASGYGLAGTFGYENDRLFYENAATENYIAGLNSLFNHVLNIHINSGGAHNRFTFSTKGGYVGMDWNDGILEYRTPPVSTGIVNFSHEYLSDDNYIARLFHEGAASGMTSFSIPQQVAYPDIVCTNITGLAPGNLEQFSILNADLDNTFSLSFLQDSSHTLKTLTVFQCNMVHPFSGNLFSYGMIPRWGLLKRIDLRGNSISTIGVDNILNEFFYWNSVSYGYAFTPMSFRIQGQTPAAPPTLASLPARNQAIWAGWAITTD